MEEALTCGQWVTDNAQLASQILAERRRTSAAVEEKDDQYGGHPGGVVVPVISFNNDLLNMQVICE
jgi:hypothetical protein